MSKETLLVVDDERHIVELARMYLEVEGYKVIAAENGEEALRQWREKRPALIVLDLMLPGIDGWEVCRRIRAESDVPIIMLTARSEDVDKIVGLELGADDYLTKPFNPRELVARVKAVLRRVALSPRANHVITIGDLTIDPARREVLVAGKPVPMRTKEFDLLCTLTEHHGIVLSREQLLNLVWGYDFYGETRTVDVHIAHLRNKLQDSVVSIETVWGVGYKLVGP
ncbi:MAG TPA: response regulator transcription factor [Anaerolineae bacterium]|nr:response regulator transcription factor [Anaerolineae bacterium]HIQ05070.1 response regulator transcription factor [Anaerolineae bacterium]